MIFADVIALTLYGSRTCINFWSQLSASPMSQSPMILSPGWLRHLRRSTAVRPRQPHGATKKSHIDLTESNC